MSLDRHHLQLLAALADHGQLGAAARSLHLSPSAASHRIREAERRLRVPLIEVKGRVARLTPAGQLLAETARVTERQLNRAEQAGRWLHHGVGTERLRVGIGCFDQLEWHRVLFDASAALGVHSVDLIGVPERSELRALDRGDVDLTVVAVAGRPPAADGWTLLADDHLVAVTPPDPNHRDRKPFQPADIAERDYLAFSFQPIEGWELDGFLDPEVARPRTLRQIDRLSTLVSLVAAGRGMSIQPELAVTHARAGHALTVTPLSVDISVRWYLVTGDPRDPVQRAARDVVLAAQAVMPPSITNSEPVQ